MSRDNILDGLKPFLAIACLSTVIAIAGASWATQNVAHAFGYQRALNGYVVTLNSRPIYQPFAILDWSKRWSRRYPKPFAVPKLVVSLSFIASLGVLMLAFRPRPPRQKPFGASAWGDAKTARALGLFCERGIVFGKLGAEFLCYDGPGHVLLTGGTRSGKTRGAVVPTLLTWPGSAIVLDVKDELHSGDTRHQFPGTAGFRSRLGPVIRLAFTQKDSACFNVLETVRIGDQEVHDVQNIVSLIADPHGDGRHKDFWDDSARSVLDGLILHVLYAEKDKTLARVFRLLADFDATAKTMLSTYHLKDPLTGLPATHPVVERGATSYLTNHEKLRAGIKATAESYLTLYDDPLIQRHTSRSDFSISDLMCGERPATLYLCWPPAEITRLKPLIRLTLGPIWFGLMESQTKGPNGAAKKHRMLLLLDEFPQLGKLDFFENSMGSMAGFDMCAFLVTQSLNFIDQAYGRDNTILDNCAVVATFAATDSRSAQKISDMIGDHIEMRAQETWSGRAGAFSLDHRAITYKEETRALLPPGEVRGLPKDEQIILPESGQPIRAKKLRYDREKIFQQRLFTSIATARGLTTTSDWSDLTGYGSRAPASSAKKQPAGKAATIDRGRDVDTPDLFSIPPGEAGEQNEPSSNSGEQFHDDEIETDGNPPELRPSEEARAGQPSSPAPGAESGASGNSNRPNFQLRTSAAAKPEKPEDPEEPEQSQLSGDESDQTEGDA